MSLNAIGSVSTSCAAYPSDGNVAEYAMAEVESDQSQVEQKNGREQVETATTLKEDARREAREALKRAEEAQKNSGFFGFVSNVLGSDIAKVAEIAGGACLAVGTGGAAVPALVAAAALTASSKAASALGVDPKICAALGVASGVAGLAVGDLSGAGEVASGSGWVTAAGIAHAAEGAASAAGGVTSGIAGHYDAEAVRDHGDSKRADAQVESEQSSIDDAFSEMEKAQKQDLQTQGIVAEAQRDNSNAELRLVNNLRG